MILPECLFQAVQAVILMEACLDTQEAMPPDTAPVLDPNPTTRTPRNLAIAHSTHRPDTLPRHRTPGLLLLCQPLDLAMLARLTPTIPQLRRRTPTMEALTCSLRSLRSPLRVRSNRSPRNTRTTGKLLVSTLEALMEDQASPSTLLPKVHTLRNPWMPLLAASHMDPPTRRNTWALAKPQFTTASMSPSTRIRLPLLPAQSRLPVHRLKRDIVDHHIHAAATANGTVTTDLVADKSSRLTTARRTGNKNLVSDA